MRTLTALITIYLLNLFVAENAFSAETLNNCFAKSGQFFAHDLEEVAQEKYTPILLLNDKNEVVGLLSVEPERAEKYPHVAKTVGINKLSLCSSLEVDSFYYTDGFSADLLDWQEASIASNVYITQDEGMIQLKVKVERDDRYGRYMRADFKAYDYADPEDAEGASEEAKAHPDFDPDWGLPKGTGTFYFYIPRNWKK